MKNPKVLKQKLAEVMRLWNAKNFGQALTEVESLLVAWPGNAPLQVMWAELVQLQDNTTHTLEDAKKALKYAVDLDQTSPAAALELGHFLDAVEDNPQAAAKTFADAAVQARRLLIESLAGQAHALLQLNKRETALRCLLEALYLADLDATGTKAKSDNGTPDILVRDATGKVLGFHVKGPFADKLEDLIQEVFVNRSA